MTLEQFMKKTSHFDKKVNLLSRSVMIAFWSRFDLTDWRKKQKTILGKKGALRFMLNEMREVKDEE